MDRDVLIKLQLGRVITDGAMPKLQARSKGTLRERVRLRVRNLSASERTHRV